MTLRQSTITTSQNRRRFAIPEAAQTYLRHRERMNAQYGYRKARQAIARLSCQAPYGSDAATIVADQIASWADRLVRCAAVLAKAPTPGETKTRVTTTNYRLAAD